MKDKNKDSELQIFNNPEFCEVRAVGRREGPDESR